MAEVPKFSTISANGPDYIFGVTPTTTLRRHIEGLEASTKRASKPRQQENKLRRFKEFFDGPGLEGARRADLARVEVGVEGPDTRFIVANLKRATPVSFTRCLLPARPG